jgi:hypothetical protein
MKLGDTGQILDGQPDLGVDVDIGTILGGDRLGDLLGLNPGITWWTEWTSSATAQHLQHLLQHLLKILRIERIVTAHTGMVGPC